MTETKKNEGVKHAVLRGLIGLALGAIVFAGVGHGMNFPWETNLVLGLVLMAVMLGFCALLFGVVVLNTGRSLPGILFLVAMMGVGLGWAFHVDGVSEENIEIAQQTADRMSRQLQGVVQETKGIDWLEPGTSCTVEVTGLPGLKQWTEMSWSELSSSDPHHLGPCRVQVVCAEATLYGSGETGYLTDCMLGDGDSLGVQDSRGVAEDKDPKLRLDTRDGRVEISDDSIGAAPPYQVSIELEGLP